MVIRRNNDYLRELLLELIKQPAETEWLEFKVGNIDPQLIGRCISALSNSAALFGKPAGYLVWGIEDETHNVLGTSFQPGLEKYGNEPLESWLLRKLRPKINFIFHETDFDGARVVILEIDRASSQPTAFDNVEAIRIGPTTQDLKSYQDKERALWRIFEKTPFEREIIADRLSDEEVSAFIDSKSFYQMCRLVVPPNLAGIMLDLERARIIARCEAGGWNITNLGALTFARELDQFPTLRRHALRVVTYKGKSRVDPATEIVGHKGYAAGFRGLIVNLKSQIPSVEEIVDGIRVTQPIYPEIAVRELVANALVHQDLSIGGAGPMVEIFSDRIEFANPGQPIIDVNRLLDTQARSRNEDLAYLMRQVGVCEERGSGVDKIVYSTETRHLPAPRFQTMETGFRATLFSPRALLKMEKRDRIWACYLHACLKYVNNDYLTNSSVRERFAISAQNKAQASRVIKEATGSGLILPYDENAPPKLMKYIPFWAHLVDGQALA